LRQGKEEKARMGGEGKGKGRGKATREGRKGKARTERGMDE